MLGYTAKMFQSPASRFRFIAVVQRHNETVFVIAFGLVFYFGLGVSSDLGSNGKDWWRTVNVVMVSFSWRWRE